MTEARCGDPDFVGEDRDLLKEKKARAVYGHAPWCPGGHVTETGRGLKCLVCQRIITRYQVLDEDDGYPD